MRFNTIIDWNTCSDAQQRELLMRPAISASESISRTVTEILDNVKARGDDALREYSAKFDKTEVGALRVTEQEIIDASNRLGDDIKQAMLAKQPERLAALRAVKAAILLEKTSGTAHELTDADVVKLMQKLVKQRRESAELYTSAGRAELAANELAEAGIIEEYLPKQLSDSMRKLSKSIILFPLLYIVK